MITSEKVSAVFQEAEEESDGDFSVALTDYEDVQIPVNVEYPTNWNFEVVEIDSRLDHDSYGYSYANSAYVIVNVSDEIENESKMFKISGTYSSYSGWNWDLGSVKEVEKKPKTVLEWVAVDD